MKTIQTLQSEADRLSDIAEKSAVKFVYSYLYRLNKHYSKIAQQHGVRVAEMRLNEITEQSLYEVYYKLYNKGGWYYANHQHTLLQKQKRFGIGFFSQLWQSYIQRQLKDPRITNKISQVTQTIKDEFRKLLLKASAENMTTQQIARLFSRELPVTRARALRIARTEMTNASSLGVDFAAETSQLKLYQVWIHSKVGNYRETHAAVNGQYRPKGTDFMIDGVNMSGPGDPRGGAVNVVNCRCRKSFLTEEGLKEFGLWKEEKLPQ